MKLGAYQFAVSGSIKNNLEKMESAVSVNFDELALAYEQLQKLADGSGLAIIVGTITRKGRFGGRGNNKWP